MLTVIVSVGKNLSKIGFSLGYHKMNNTTLDNKHLKLCSVQTYT